MKVFIVIVALLFAGCAFKKSETKLNAQNIEVITFPQTRMPQNEIRTHFKISEKEITTTTNEQIVLLPDVVPDEIDFEISLITLEAQSLRGEIEKDQKKVREIPSAAFFIQNKNTVRFRLAELKSLFSQEEQSEITIKLIDSLSHAEVIHLTLLTPPSRLTSTAYFPVAALEKTLGIRLPESVLKFTTDQTTDFYLGGVFEIKNHEAYSVELELPQIIQSELELIEKIISLTTNECSNSISENTTSKKIENLNSKLLLRPLNGEAKVVIAAHSTLYLGLYGVEETILLPQDHLSSHLVTRSCEAQCKQGAEGDWSDVGKWGQDCLNCGNSPGNSGDSCYRCMQQHRNWCKWQDWRSWTNTETVQAGIASSFVLSLPAKEHLFQISFIDPTKTHFFAKRKIKLMDKKIIIKH